MIGFGATFAESLAFPVAMKLDARHLPYVHRLQLAINLYLATPALVIIVLTGMYQVSDADLESALRGAGTEPGQVQAILDENAGARIAGLRVALAVLALIAVVALFLTRLLPVEPVGSSRKQSSSNA